MADQADGLRRWAQTRPVPALEGPTLLVVGLPGDSAAPAVECLCQWAARGRRWVGDPHAWRVVPLAADSPHLPVLAGRQPRWALWVDTGPDGFRRGYGLLGQLYRGGGPRRLLALHPPGLSRAGLLGNLRGAAARCFGIDLLLLAS